MRQIVLDTETTGIGHDQGHGIIEIGCVELIDRKLTGNHFHTYLNPQRQVDEGAFKVHGISNEFLQNKPIFKEVVSDFIEFINDSELIIHNAPFDVGFLNAELKRIQWPKSLHTYCNVLDSLVLARQKHPGQRNSLDALCKRYEIDNSNRQLHGALLDAEILAWVYLAMTGGQGDLFAKDDITHPNTQIYVTPIPEQLAASNSPVTIANAEELVKHEEFIQFLISKSGVNYWANE